MKYLFFFFLLPVFSFGQVHQTPEDIYFDKVIYIQDKSRDQLFLAAREWYAEAFRKFPHTISWEDRKNGKIVGYGDVAFKIKMENLIKVVGTIAKQSPNTHARLLFVIKTYFKDGRTRLMLTRTKVVRFKGQDVKAELPLSKFYFNNKKEARTKLQGLKAYVAELFEKVAEDYERSVRKNSDGGEW